MTNILARIARHNRELVAQAQAVRPLADLAAQAREQAQEELSLHGRHAYPFLHALSVPPMGFICECKCASPSKGVIAPVYDPVAIARDYEQAGAVAVSVLTEPLWFHGSLEHLAAVSRAVDIPTLRKDFIVDPYQLYEAKLAGAAAVLLICSILDDDELPMLIALAEELGMDALVEAYEPDEVPRAYQAGARIIGVNNRDLRSFSVDFGRSISLRAQVGPERIFVSESGVETAEDVALLNQAQVDAVLVGETLMRAPNKQTALNELTRLI